MDRKIVQSGNSDISFEDLAYGASQLFFVPMA